MPSRSFLSAAATILLVLGLAACGSGSGPTMPDEDPMMNVQPSAGSSTQCDAPLDGDRAPLAKPATGQRRGSAPLR